MTLQGLHIDWVPSNNFGERRRGQVPELVVIHYTAMESAKSAIDRLCSEEHEVSAHYLADNSGRLVGLVDEGMRAWHAGSGMWGGLEDVNSRSIGIEIANPGEEPFPAKQMLVIEQLLRSVIKRWRIRPERVIAHSDCALGRKHDPGPRFDWRRLAVQGLSVWPGRDRSREVNHDRFVEAAVRFGYQPADHYAGSDYFADLLAAVRLRFRPWGSGPLDERDMSVILDISKRYPYSA